MELFDHKHQSPRVQVSCLPLIGLLQRGNKSVGLQVVYRYRDFLLLVFHYQLFPRQQKDDCVFEVIAQLRKDILTFHDNQFVSIFFELLELNLQQG